MFMLFSTTVESYKGGKYELEYQKLYLCGDTAFKAADACVSKDKTWSKTSGSFVSFTEDEISFTYFSTVRFRPVISVN